MPNYDYFCEANGKTIEVNHRISESLSTWGEVCFTAQISLDDTDFEAPVRKVIRPVSVAIPTSNSTLKEKGFTKLVKRDDGVYENVTALDRESRYMKAGDNSTIPQLHKKISS